MNDDHIRRIRCVGALVRDGRDRLLLIRRGRDPGAGLWSIPGGKVEPGESDPEALTREVLEETGLAVAVGDHVGSVERPAPGGLFEIHDYRCAITGGDLSAGDDADAATWVDLAMFTTLRDRNAVVDSLWETLAEWGELPG
ncbi:NUDIX hydrolase [Actinokineospora globicatena]|uniref:NUDIX hydrolase n=1 Tax=Actinokineospora globicatena TaxID=103729 RepID=UPI0020A30674|nr:NUDIX domain-containing protein [Actinokineospora globicatena]MCP2300415.1 ADP-ribose pyrophosphatase YjhB, NUDIX family [Actinokineospora globicatena]GLW80948.1 NUDIX hydrolase [Actinokineospora globicatena]GLW88141.1 NUDIX hydrolase [Actinokineospora globicatena]